MRIFKLISLCAVCLALNACKTFETDKNVLLTQEGMAFDQKGQEIPQEQQTVKPVEMMRVGVLLPLTGNAAKVGSDLKNAALTALFDAPDNRLVLQFYDTLGTPLGARDAADLAVRQGAELIIGPVFAKELRAMRSKAYSEGIGIITFSSDPTNVGKGVYTISTLTSQQVAHIVSYACSKGYKRFAIFGPDNSAGDMIALAAKGAADKCGGMITKASFYNPKTDNLLPVVSAIMPKMIEELEKERDEYVQSLQTVLDDDSSEMKTVKVKTKVDIDGKEEIQMTEKTMTAEELTAYIEEVKAEELVRDPFEFDAILVPEESSRLRSFGALFSYFDVPPEVKILGTSQWATSHPEREAGLVGGWFSSMPAKQFKEFSDRFQKLYGEKPARIATQAYDAVSLAAVLAKTGDLSYDQLTDAVGFQGKDGLFRLLENGLSERGLAVMGVEKKGFVLIEPAPDYFDVAPDITREVYIEDYRHSPDLITIPEPEPEAAPAGDENAARDAAQTGRTAQPSEAAASTVTPTAP